MEKFYVAHNGVQKGPWSFAEVSAKLTNKEIAWNDYLYDQKTEDWILLLEYPLLTELFNKSFANPIIVDKKPLKESQDPVKDRAWYILKQNNNYGPFSQVEMIQMLQSKTLFEFDFVWKRGLESWKRLAEIPEFKPDQIREIFQSLPPDSSSEVFFRRRHARVEYVSSLVLHNRKKLFTAHSFEISAGGAGLVIEHADFAIDSEVYLHFSPSDQVPAFNAVCKVASKFGNKYGMQFLNITAQAKESISKLTKKAA
ncbi:MAG: GYF domain-containing protein [Pseudobdellovibrio sp.]